MASGLLDQSHSCACMAKFAVGPCACFINILRDKTCSYDLQIVPEVFTQQTLPYYRLYRTIIVCAKTTNGPYVICLLCLMYIKHQSYFF